MKAQKYVLLNTDIDSVIEKARQTSQDYKLNRVVAIASFCDYDTLYRREWSKSLNIETVKLNDYQRCGASFLAAINQALMLAASDNPTLIIFDDLRDFIQYGQIYDPACLTSCLSLIKDALSYCHFIFNSSSITANRSLIDVLNSKLI